jgi:transcriptional regulator with XRE-family HTH domain
MAVDAAVREQLQALGSFIRTQRQQAKMSLRDLADLTNVSNPYLSQIERGLHEPSMRVLKSISVALNVSIDTLLARAGVISEPIDDDGDAGDGQTNGRRVAVLDTASAILADPALDEVQRRSLLAVYRSYLDAPR